ncbi:MAG: dUTP diphosphatase [Candidatus Blackburnbacteria bacterium]|nr:dUTP diphosphatase [Candidatus Blackburnbacteria bacterium]
MESPSLKFKLLSPNAKLPQYAHTTNAGFDLYSLETETLKPGERHLFIIGIASEIPEDWFVSLRDKSGLATKYGLHNLGGVIDSGYRGEWGVNMINLGKEECTIEVGDKISQGILQQAPQANIQEVKELSESDRGEGGFGSTGKQ